MIIAWQAVQKKRKAKRIRQYHSWLTLVFSKSSLRPQLLMNFTETEIFQLWPANRSNCQQYLHQTEKNRERGKKLLSICQLCAPFLWRSYLIDMHGNSLGNYESILIENNVFRLYFITVNNNWCLNFYSVLH